MKQTVQDVTEQIINRSRKHRLRYLENMDENGVSGPFRHRLPSSNLAHSMAVCRGIAEQRMHDEYSPHIAVITTPCGVRTCHDTIETLPDILKKGVAVAGGVAQMAAGVPAMCDGVTQGEAGMDL